MIRPDEYDEAYGLLIQVCERYVALTDAAVLCVMEAFNILAELRAPTAVPPNDPGEPDELMLRAVDLLSQLTRNASALHEALALARARELLATALEERR